MKQETSQSTKKEQYRTKGFFLIEALFSVAVFALLATAFSGAYLYGREASVLSGNRYQAVALAEEGLEVIRNFREENFANLTAGDHGLIISGNQWVFSGTSDKTGIFTRTISITDIDTDTKEVLSTVTWQQNNSRMGTVSLSSRFTNWSKIGVIEADELDVDVSAVDVGVDPTQVTGITVENLSTQTDITVASMTVSWAGASGGTRIQNISIDGGSVWSGNSSSGSVLDITDFVLAQGAGTYPIDFFQFSKDMNGSTVTVVFTMLDASEKQVVFSPGSPPDVTPPSDVTDLFISNITGDSVDLNWTAPGDDGVIGTASGYDIRYSTSPITLANWGTATQLVGEPAPSVAGTLETMNVPGLSPSTLYYFAMISSDEASNMSGLSNVVSTTTLSPAESSFLSVNTVNMALSAGNSEVTGIDLQNVGPADITIASITLTWSGVSNSRRVTEIIMDGISRWTGSKKTGNIEDITDTIIPAETTIPLDSIFFSSSINGINLDITFTMLDGSLKTISGLTPN